MKKVKIEGTSEAWETGELGRSMENAQPAPAHYEQQIDEAMGMQMISIRLPKELVEDFKMIARFHKLGYQPLMRDALKRFAASELKIMAIEYAAQREAEEKARVKAKPAPETPCEEIEASHHRIAA
jgi:vacuolar-type H+-ATPase subunit C/Vma6